MSLVPNRAIEGAAGNQGGYTIQRSLRFRSSASAYLSRTPASASNRTTWTWSGWVKRGALGTTTGMAYQQLFGACPASGSDATFTELVLNGNDTLQVGGWTTTWKVTTQVFRDTSAWYHFVWVLDTGNATAADRMRLYVNGSRITSFSTSNDPSLNATLGVNNNVAHALGSEQPYSSRYFDGYMAEVNFIDGQALTPSSFGETDTATGVWKPKKYGGSYGTNGFYLPFSDNTSATTLAYDKSGNGNNWTPNNISTTAGSTYDSMLDVPTLTSATAANYCVLNPLFTNQTGINSSNTGTVTLTNANLTAAPTTGAIAGTIGTIGVSSGKWYFETIIGTASASGDVYGFITAFTGAGASTWIGYRTSGNIYANGTTYSGYATATSGDVIGIALDIGGSTVSCYKNGTLLATQSLTTAITADCFPLIWFRNDPANASVNFGQRPFSYTPPTGFKALNTFNLPDPTIKKPNQYMDATTYTGNGSTQSITNGGFQPDFVWMKKRSAAESHILQNSTTGTTKFLMSNSTAAEDTSSAIIQSFDASGFTVGASSVVNGAATTYVGWQWKAGGTAVTNTTGSTSCQLSASPSSGFSVATFTPPASGTSFTIGHGLGVAPKMIITKIRNNAAANWFVYHESMGNTGYMALNATNGNLGPFTGAWNNTSPTSSVATFGSYWIGSSYNMVAYMFSEIAGFSKFGSYTGNGSTDGPFVYCGFRPKYVMVKLSSAAGENWELWDSSRGTYNINTPLLYANLSNAETSGTAARFDALSNGFKIRNTNAGVNTNGATYIYAAFAENPQKYSLAR